MLRRLKELDTSHAFKCLLPLHESSLGRPMALDLLKTTKTSECYKIFSKVLGCDTKYHKILNNELTSAVSNKENKMPMLKPFAQTNCAMHCRNLHTKWHNAFEWH